MSLSKGHWLTISSSLLGIGTGIAATVGQQLLTTSVTPIVPELFLSAGMGVGGGIAVNLLSNVAQKLCHSISKNVVISHPAELNHDLQKILISCTERSLKNILILYKDQIPSHENLKKARQLIEEIGIRLKDLFNDTEALLQYNEHIKVYIHTPIDQANGKLLLLLKEQLEHAGVTEDFVLLFKDSFTAQFRLCFAEELKDPDNQTSWIAFQKMMLEVIKADLQQLLTKTTGIEKGIEELKDQQTMQHVLKLSPKKTKALADLLKELNHPAGIKLKLDRALNDLLDEIKKELVQIKHFASETHREVLGLRRDLEKGKVKWLNSKMIAAYLAVIIFAGSIFILKLRDANKPFEFSVVIHGPLGPGDNVLQNRGVLVLTYGNKTEHQSPDENGQVFFKMIPGKYDGDSCIISLIGLEGEPYRSVRPFYKVKLEPDKPFYLPLKPFGIDKLYGIVIDNKGRPLVGTTLTMQGMKTISDVNGYFQFSIPIQNQKRFQDITATKVGYKDETVFKIPPHTQDKPVEIQLQKSTP